MSDLRENLTSEFQDTDYRYAYAESFLNTKIATQIKTLREQRGKKQSELGAVVGTKQSGFSRFEDVNHSVWKTDTLWKIARALDVRVNISFETFGSLIDDKERFNKESLQRPEFKDDPAFKEPAVEEPEPEEAFAFGGGTSLLQFLGARPGTTPPALRATFEESSDWESYAPIRDAMAHAVKTVLSYPQHGNFGLGGQPLDKYGGLRLVPKPEPAQQISSKTYNPSPNQITAQSLQRRKSDVA